MIAGLLDYLTERHPGSKLVGFRGGPGGILAKDIMEITQDNMVSHPGSCHALLLGNIIDPFWSRSSLSSALAEAMIRVIRSHPENGVMLASMSRVVLMSMHCSILQLLVIGKPANFWMFTA